MLSCTVPELGVKKKHKEKYSPHSISFPATFSALMVYMGLETHSEVREIGEESVIYDLDYIFHMGVSGEGFGMRVNTLNDIVLTDSFQTPPVRDCFDVCGIRYSIVYSSNPTFSDKVMDAIENGYPVIMINRTGHNNDHTYICVGYEESGAYLRVNSNNYGVNILHTSKLRGDWKEDGNAFIIIDGRKKPADRREIVYRSLERAKVMLAGIDGYGEYGFGAKLWDNWKSRLSDDENYRSVSSEMKFISPEKADVSERRLTSADFLKLCEEYTGENSLEIARDSFRQIADYMSKVDAMVSGDKKGSLRDHGVRMEICSMLDECRKLDIRASNNIGVVVKETGIKSLNSSAGEAV